MTKVKKLLVLFSAVIIGFCVNSVSLTDSVAQEMKSVEQVNPLPRTNAEIRQWYNDQVSVVSERNEQWAKEGASVEERALRAYEIRHNARIQARAMMRDKEEVEMLRARDMKKYGNFDGPSFDYLVEKNSKKGMKGDSIYEAILGSSARTNAKYNEKYGVKKQAE